MNNAEVISIYKGITPYKDVNFILQKLISRVKNALKSNFLGMYLHGSLACGDFNPETSDIDFLVITAEELTTENIEELQRLHTELVNLNSIWAKRLDGSYVSLKYLKELNPPKNPRPYINGEKFSKATYGSEWFLEKQLLLERGIVIEGPSPDTFITPVESNKLKMASLSILNQWWKPMLKDNSWLNNTEYQVYGVLTMCRIIYTLEHGVIASKPVSAIWVMKYLDKRWNPLIKEALAWRNGNQLDILEELLGFIKFTLQYSEKFKLL